jgi:dihydroorotate dehydrogenase electron transfer subunit
LELAGDGAPMALLGPLGKPFAPVEGGAGDWLVAGGVGLAPLLWFAERYRQGHQLVYGARSAADLVLLDEIRAAGARVILTTEDGSAPAGWPVTRGRVTDALAEHLPRHASPSARVLTCGPNPMMRAVVELARAHDLPCLVSVEGEMACGIGACLGCALPLRDGTKPFAYACVDGPVFDAARVEIP